MRSVSSALYILYKHAVCEKLSTFAGSIQIPPFQGLDCIDGNTQGVALGYKIAGFQPDRVDRGWLFKAIKFRALF